MKGHAWTKKQVTSAQVPNYSKLFVIRPALFSLFGAVKGKSILEMGCGNGFWLRLLKARGARCTGIDTAKNQMSAAQKAKDGITYTVMNAAHTTFKSNLFDMVLLEKVLLEIPKLTIIRNIMKEAYRVVKKGGTLIVSDLHPIAPNCNLPNVRPMKGYQYFKSETPIQIVSKRIDGKETIYTDYHYTFEDLMSAMTDDGFKIIAVKEPRPSSATIKKYPYLRYRQNDPVSLIIKAVK